MKFGEIIEDIAKTNEDGIKYALLFIAESSFGSDLNMDIVCKYPGGVGNARDALHLQIRCGTVGSVQAR